MIGQTLAQYRIVEKIGGGGMGVVYLARDTKLERAVALKFLPPQWCQDDGAKQRFLREAQAASATNHRNICIIHDIEQTADGQLFIVMAYYEGRTLKERLEQRALPAAEAIEIAAEVAEGLAKAHSQGVVHRDIKPGNIILTEDGVKILDFGLAKLADAALKLTLEGSTLGTVAYMSPEQARGEEADERSDIWALGVVLYEMLTGEPPFKGAYPEAVFYAIKNEAPSPLARVEREMPEGVERIVQRALEKDPAVRYQSARELARELRHLQGRSLPLDLRTEPLPSMEGKGLDLENKRYATRRRGRALVTVAVAAVAVAGLGAYAWLARPLPRTPIAIVPVANHTGDPELDAYRLALTQSLISELTDSPNLRPTPYFRTLEILRRFIAGNGDISGQEAVASLASESGASLLIAAVLEYKDGAWLARADLRNPSTGTDITTVRTEARPSSLRNETVHELVRTLASNIQEQFPPRWPHRPRARPPGSRFRNLEAARAFEAGLNAYEQMEFGAALAAFRQSTEHDPYRAVSHAWLSRTALIMGDIRGAEAGAQAAAKVMASDSAADDIAFVTATLADARNDRDAAEDSYRELLRVRAGDLAGQVELADFLKRQGRNSQAVDAFHKALTVDSRFIRAHVELCQLYSALDNYPLAEKHAQTALQRFRAIGHRNGEAQALLCYADGLLQQGTRVAEARTYLENARRIFEALNHRYGLSRAYQYLGYLAARERNYTAAIDAFQQALVGSREVGNRQLEGLELMNIGLARARMGQISAAVEYFQQSRDVYHQVGDQRRSAEGEVLAAGLQIDYGIAVSDAMRRVANARTTLRALGHADFEVLSMQVEALALRNAGRAEDALRLLRQALSVATERNLTDKIYSLNTDIGVAFSAIGDLDAARKALEPALAGGSPEPRIALARVEVKLKNFADAKKHLDEARRGIQSAGELMLMPQLHLALGELALASGAEEDAHRYFADAAASWTENLADAASVEARCYIGVMQRRPALIESTVAQSLRLGRSGLADRCRSLSGTGGLPGKGESPVKNG